MNKKTTAIFLLKKFNNIKKAKSKKEISRFYKPYREQKKVWAKTAENYTYLFANRLELLFNEYKEKVIKILLTNEIVFNNVNKEIFIKKTKYKTAEYLDEMYNHVVVSDIKDKLLSLNQNFSDNLNKVYDTYISKGIVKDSAELAFKNLKMEFNFNKFNERTRNRLENKKIKWSKEVSENTQKSIKRQLVDGYKKGLSIYDIRNNLIKDTGFSYSRCEAIAVTEIISSCNYSDYISFIQNPYVIGVQWSSSGDSRVRPSHKAANGQKREKYKRFIIGRSTLLYPGDSSSGAEAKELIRCRCTIYPIFQNEGIESNTIYDAENVGSEDWLYEQENEFKIDYLGSRRKADLFNNGLLYESDYNKSWKSLKSEILAKTGTNFKKLILPALTAEVEHIVLKETLLVLKTGLETHKENMTIIDIENKKSLYQNFSGDKNEVGFTEDMLKDMAVSKNNNLIIIHNHPNATSFSANDLSIFFKNKSIKYLIAVGHNGIIYVAEKYKNNLSINDNILNKEIDRLYYQYINKNNINIKIKNFILIRDFIKASDFAMKQYSKNKFIYHYGG